MKGENHLKEGEGYFNTNSEKRGETKHRKKKRKKESLPPFCAARRRTGERKKKIHWP